MIGDGGDRSHVPGTVGLHPVHADILYVIEDADMPAVGHLAGKTDIPQGQAVHMLGKEAVGGQDPPGAGLRIGPRQLRYVIGIPPPAVLPGIPVCPGQQAFASGEEGVHQPGEILDALLRVELGELPLRVQLPLFHGVLHGQAASVLHGDILQNDTFYMGIRQPHQQDRVAGIRVGDGDVADQYITHGGHGGGSDGIGI